MKESKGKVCVTGGTGFVGSWLIMKLLNQGYFVNTTIRTHPGSKRDISYLTTLPGASERLKIFNADLTDPDSFGSAIEGCTGVFHVAHPIDDFDKEETEEETVEKSVKGMLGILQECVRANVKRVVYTSSAVSVMFNDEGGSELRDEDSWSDNDYIRKLNILGGSYCVCKTITERVALEFGEKHCIDVVSVIPPWVVGPFMCPQLPTSNRMSLAMIFGIDNPSNYYTNIPLVHVEDLADAHIFVFEHPKAKGRYICSAVNTTNEKLHEFFSAKYPEYKLTSPDSLTVPPIQSNILSPKKLLEIGFQCKHGVEEMFDGAIQCCKQKGFL